MSTTSSAKPTDASATSSADERWPVPLLAGGREPLSEVLLPLHPEYWSDRAGTTAAVLAARWRLPLRLVQVSSAEADGQWAEAAIRWARASLAVEPEIEAAPAVAPTVQPGSLVVLGSRHDNDWSAVPPALDALLGELRGPVVACGPHATPGLPAGSAGVGVAGTMGGVATSVLAPVDTSPTAEAALDPAVELARSMGATVWLVRVVDDITAADITRQRAEGRQASESSYVRAMAAELESGGVSSGWEVLRVTHATEIAPTLGHFAVDRGVSLVVASRKGAGGSSAQSLGRVSRSLVATSTVPVLLA